MTLASVIDRLSRIWLVLGGFFVAAFFVVTVVILNEIGADSREIDLAALWAGARMAMHGQAVEAFNQPLLQTYMGEMFEFGGGLLHWRYPANLHVVIAPLGLLPFTVMFGVVLAASVAAMWRAFAPIADKIPGGLNLILTAPVCLYTLTTGQIALLFVAALGGGLVALAQGHRRRAGLLLGLLCLKPSLAPVAVIAAIASRDWTTLAWATVSGVGLAVAGTLAFGIEHWEVFFASLAMIQEEAARNMIFTDRMVSPFAMFHALGMPTDLALSVHLVIAIGVAIGVAVLWARVGDFNLKAAALGLAIPLATPYVHFYELGFALLAVVFLTRAWPQMSRPRGVLLATLWITPVPGVMFWLYIPLAYYAPPLLLFAFLVVLADGLRKTTHGGTGHETAKL